MTPLHERPTPLTDAAVAEMIRRSGYVMVLPCFARDLERKLALCWEALDIAKDGLDTAEAALDPTYKLERQEIVTALHNAKAALDATSPSPPTSAKARS